MEKNFTTCITTSSRHIITMGRVNKSAQRFTWRVRAVARRTNCVDSSATIETEAAQSSSDIYRNDRLRFAGFAMTGSYSQDDGGDSQYEVCNSVADTSTDETCYSEKDRDLGKLSRVIDRRVEMVI